MAIIDCSPDEFSSICSPAEETLESHGLHPLSPIVELSDGSVSEADSDDVMSKKLKDLSECHAGITAARNRDTIDSILSKYGYAAVSEGPSLPRDVDVENVSTDLSNDSHQYSHFHGTYVDYYEGSSWVESSEHEELALPTSPRGTGTTTTKTTSENGLKTVNTSLGGMAISTPAFSPTTAPSQSSRHHSPGSNLNASCTHDESKMPTHHDLLQQFQKLEDLQAKMDDIISEHSTPPRSRPVSRYIASQISTHCDSSASGNMAEDDETIGSDTTCVEGVETHDEACQKRKGINEAFGSFENAVDEDACSQVVLTAAFCLMYALVLLSGMPN